MDVIIHEVKDNTSDKKSSTYKPYLKSFTYGDIEYGFNSSSGPSRRFMTSLIAPNDTGEANKLIRCQTNQSIQ